MTPPMTGGQNLGVAHGSIVIDTSQLGRAVQQTQNFAHQIESTLGSLRNLAGISIAGFGVQQIAQAAVAMADLGNQVRFAQLALVDLSGGSAQAAANLQAIQRAAGGTIDRLQAMQIANQAMALGLANTTDQFEELVRAARGVTLVSPVIHDVGSAITEISLAAANLSFRRLDQLGLSVTDVKNRMAELQRVNKDLTDQIAFQESVVGLLNEKYGELADEAVSDLDRLRAAHRDYMQSLLAERSLLDELAGAAADNIEMNRQAAEIVKIAQTNLDGLTEAQKEVVLAAREMAAAWEQTGLRPDPAMAALIEQFNELAAAIESAAAAAAGPRRTGLVQGTPALHAAQLRLEQLREEHAARFREAQREGQVSNRQGRVERIEQFQQQEQAFRDEFERAASQRADAVRQHERQRLDTVRQYERQRADTTRQYEESRSETVRQYESQRAESIRQYEQEIAREAEDFARHRQRAQEQFNRQIAELQEEAARREAEWRADLEQTLSELREDSSERVADLQVQADRERARRESDHRERLLEAAARLDARAIAQEQRRFAKEETERQQDLDGRLADERENLQERIDEETAAAEERLREAREADTRRLADMQEDFAERQRIEDEDRALRLARNAEDHERQLNQEDAFHVERLNQLDTSYADQLARMDSAHAEQLARQDELYAEQSEKMELSHRQQLQKLDDNRLNVLGIYDEMNRGIAESALRAKTAIETGQQMTPEMRASINWSSPTPPSWWIGPWTPIYAPPEQPQSPSAESSSVVISEGAVQISGVGDPVGVGREVESALLRVLRSLS